MTKINFLYTTDNNLFTVTSSISVLQTSDTLYNYQKCALLCHIGCKNFNLKYSCPPHSPSFDKYSRNKSFIVVNAVKINTWEQKRIYNAIRMANVISKSIQKKAFDFIHSKFQAELSLSILENGSCRLCKKCKLQDNLPCKHPEKMHPSLEATGIDVNDLVKKAFGFELQWYKKGSFPEYQCVVGGILTNEPEMIQDELSLYYNKKYNCLKTKLAISQQLELEEICYK